MGWGFRWVDGSSRGLDDSSGVDSITLILVVGVGLFILLIVLRR